MQTRRAPHDFVMIIRNEANKLTQKRCLWLLSLSHTKIVLSLSSVDNVNISLFTSLIYLSIFDSYSPQPQWILLNNPRDEVEYEANSCFSIIAKYCFNKIAQVLPISDLNSFSFWNHSVRIVSSTRIEISSHFPLEFDGFIQFNQQKLHTFLSKSVTLNILSSFVLFRVIFSSIAFITLCVTLKKRARSIHFEI